MGVVSSQPRRGDKIINKDGAATDSFSEYMSAMTDSNNLDNPKNNFIATTPPAVSNNTDEGYTRGSMWNDVGTIYMLTSFIGTDANWTALN